MPTYQYVCRTCGHQLEAVQSFTDEPLTECPTCDDGRLRKVFSSVGVVFKGSGFYRTDSREKPKVSTSSEGSKSSDSGASTGSSSSTTPSNGSSTGSSGGSGGTKPATATAASS